MQKLGFRDDNSLWQQIEARKRDYLILIWHHYAHSNSREIVRLFFIIFVGFLFIILFLINKFIYLIYFYFTILYWLCHTLTWIHHVYTCVPHPEHPSNLPPHPIPVGHPSAPAPRTLYLALKLYWWFISHMIIYMFQCHSPISSCPHPLPRSPKDCSIYLCLFCCLTYRVIVTIFLNSIYMC